MIAISGGDDSGGFCASSVGCYQRIHKVVVEPTSSPSTVAPAADDDKGSALVGGVAGDSVISFVDTFGFSNPMVKQRIATSSDDDDSADAKAEGKRRRSKRAKAPAPPLCVVPGTKIVSDRENMAEETQTLARREGNADAVKAAKP